MRDEVGLTRGLEAVKGRVVKHRGHPKGGLSVTAARRVRGYGRC